MVNFLTSVESCEFLFDVKCGIKGDAYRLLEVMLLFGIPKLQNFISFVTLGTL